MQIRFERICRHHRLAGGDAAGNFKDCTQSVPCCTVHTRNPPMPMLGLRRTRLGYAMSSDPKWQPCSSQCFCPRVDPTVAYHRHDTATATSCCSVAVPARNCALRRSTSDTATATALTCQCEVHVAEKIHHHDLSGEPNVIYLIAADRSAKTERPTRSGERGQFLYRRGYRHPCHVSSRALESVGSLLHGHVPEQTQTVDATASPSFA